MVILTLCAASRMMLPSWARAWNVVLGVKNYNNIKVGDQLEIYELLEIARKI